MATTALCRLPLGLPPLLARRAAPLTPPLAPPLARLLGTKPSPYRVLSLPTWASHDDIKKRFRELARAHHPDLNPDADLDAFSEIIEAYDDLMDDDFAGRVADR